MNITSHVGHLADLFAWPEKDVVISLAAIFLFIQPFHQMCFQYCSRLVVAFVTRLGELSFCVTFLEIV